MTSNTKPATQADIKVLDKKINSVNEKVEKLDKKVDNIRIELVEKIEQSKEETLDRMDSLFFKYKSEFFEKIDPVLKRLQLQGRTELLSQSKYQEIREG